MTFLLGHLKLVCFGHQKAFFNPLQTQSQKNYLNTYLWILRTFKDALDRIKRVFPKLKVLGVGNFGFIAENVMDNKGY